MHAPRERGPLTIEDTWKRGVMRKQLEVGRVTDYRKKQVTEGKGPVSPASWEPCSVLLIQLILNKGTEVSPQVME